MRPFYSAQCLINQCRRSSPSYSSMVSLIISRDRSEKISRYLHFSDKLDDNSQQQPAAYRGFFKPTLKSISAFEGLEGGSNGSSWVKGGFLNHSRRSCCWSWICLSKVNCIWTPNLPCTGWDDPFIYRVLGRFCKRDTPEAQFSLAQIRR